MVYEDEAILVLDKPTGISVTGERHDTDLVELATAAGEWLMPAHRIDKVTSGLVLFAKSIEVHGGLTRQFNRRTVAKTYLAVTCSTGLPPAGVIDLPLSVGRKSRVRVAALRESIEADGSSSPVRWGVPAGKVFTADRHYPSETTFVRVEEHADHTALVVRPITGRRHQIRVHLAWIGHPIDGDPLFEKQPSSPRTHLHSWRLAFDADWQADRRMQLTADPTDDFWTPLGRLPADGLARSRAALAELGTLGSSSTSSPPPPVAGDHS